MRLRQLVRIIESSHVNTNVLNALLLLFKHSTSYFVEFLYNAAGSFVDVSRLVPYFNVMIRLYLVDLPTVLPDEYRPFSHTINVKIERRR